MYEDVVAALAEVIEEVLPEDAEVFEQNNEHNDVEPLEVRIFFAIENFWINSQIILKYLT